MDSSSPAAPRLRSRERFRIDGDVAPGGGGIECFTVTPANTRPGSPRCSRSSSARPPPEERELVLSLAPILFEGMPPRIAPGPAARGGGRAHPQAPLSLHRARDAARPPALQGRPRHPRHGHEPERGGVARDRRRGRAAARDHDPQDPHRRPALHLRQPQELPAEVGAARLRRLPPDLHGAAAVGARRGVRRRARRGQQGELLPVPHRADPVAGGAAAHRARGVLAAQGGVPGGRRLQGHGPRLRRARPEAALASRRRARARSPRGRSWSGCRTTTTSSWARCPTASCPTASSRGWARPRTASSATRRCCRWCFPGVIEHVEAAPPPAAAATGASWTSTSAPTPPPSTTSSRSRT